MALPCHQFFLGVTPRVWDRKQIDNLGGEAELVKSWACVWFEVTPALLTFKITAPTSLKPLGPSMLPSA